MTVVGLYGNRPIVQDHHGSKIVRDGFKWGYPAHRSDTAPTLFHGTISTHVDSIMTHGLNPNRQSSTENIIPDILRAMHRTPSISDYCSISLSFSYKTAVSHAKQGPELMWKALVLYKLGMMPELPTRLRDEIERYERMMQAAEPVVLYMRLPLDYLDEGSSDTRFIKWIFDEKHLLSMREIASREGLLDLRVGDDTLVVHDKARIQRLVQGDKLSFEDAVQFCCRQDCYHINSQTLPVSPSTIYYVEKVAALVRGDETAGI